MFAGQKIIGIVPMSPVFGETENRYDDKYLFTDTYGVRVMEAGMLPVGVLPVEGRIRTNVLELCDGFILQGGKTVRPHHIDVIDYALQTGKKVLGICLGCQGIQCYFATKAEAERRHWTGNLADLYAILKFQENYPFLGPVEGHKPSLFLPRGNKDVTKHKVFLAEDSHAAKIFGNTQVMGASFHILRIENPAPGLVVSGRAEDGTVEAIEYGDTVIGTQFHPDADEDLHMIFDWLAQ